METKQCTSCNEELSIDNFYRDRTPIHTISYCSKCKKCCKIQAQQRIKREPNSNIVSKICSICNLEQSINNFYKSYRHKDGYFKWCSVCHENKCKNKELNRKIKRTPEYMIEYNKRKQEDVIFNFKYQIRSNLRSYLKKNINCSKQNKTMKYIGCSMDFLKAWFEYNFDENMDWSNRGKYWHIDHIKPCNSFDLTIQDEIYKCYNWINLRPCEKNNNILKSDKIDNNIINEFEAKSKEFLKTITYNIEDGMYILLPGVKAPTLIKSE
jgi:hypothetical protein